MTEAVADFTLEALVWKPYVRPVDTASVSPAQVAAITAHGPLDKVSDYIKVLAQDAEILAERTPLFNDIMYSAGGLSRGARELGALGASVTNHCVYCAYVHANRYNSLEKDSAVVATIFAEGVEADLAPREQAIFNFAVELTRAPEKMAAIGGYHIHDLRANGLSDLEILDLIHSIAIFGWANRLMHTLGAPHRRPAPSPAT